MKIRFLALCLIAACAASTALAEKYFLLAGVDARHYPGQPRFIPPDTQFGPVYDGDRLAGTSDVGPLVRYVGTGQPMYEPNHLGSLTMLLRRGTVPVYGGIHLLGIEFLGGPLLDLDGNPDPPRSLVPVPPNPAVEIPGTDSFIELVPDFGAGTLTLVDFDATGCNEGGPGIGPAIATVLITIAGTQPDDTKTGPINPNIDTRVGQLTPFTGHSGTLTGVYRVTNLGYELWEDSIDPYSASADVLGTMQYLGTFRGWLVQRDPATGRFPTLAGEGLGSTRWPDVDTVHVGQTFNTANGLQGGSATISNGVSGDPYDAPGNGGLPLTDFGGDLGAYFDHVVVPRLPHAATRFVYLESAGFGINNSNDPVFTDTNGYDVSIIAATASCGAWQRGDINCDGLVDFNDIDCFVAALSGGQAAWQACRTPGANCDYLCQNDINDDGAVDFSDIDPFVAILSGG